MSWSLSTSKGLRSAMLTDLKKTSSYQKEGSDEAVAFEKACAALIALVEQADEHQQPDNYVPVFQCSAGGHGKACSSFSFGVEYIRREP